MINLATKARPYIGAVILTCALLTAGGIYSATRMASGVYPEVTFPRSPSWRACPTGTSPRWRSKLPGRWRTRSAVFWVSPACAPSPFAAAAKFRSIFTPGADMRRAETLIWNRIGADRSELPPNVDLTVEQMTPSVFPIISVVLTAKKGINRRLNRPLFLGQDCATTPNIRLAPAHQDRFPTCSYANVAGGDIREVEVIARPDDLLAAGLSAADLADQITQQSNLHPVGRTEGQPLRLSDHRQQSARNGPADRGDGDLSRARTSR